MNRKKKYYVVWKGRKSGVLDSWEACQHSVHGFKGARYKSFDTLKSAQRAFLEAPLPHVKQCTSRVASPPTKQLGAVPGPILNSLSVDAACSGNPGLMEYRGVDTKTREEIFREGPFEEATNNIGEFLALVHGLAMLKEKKDARLIYSDSQIAIGWVRRKATRTTLSRTDRNRNVFALIERAIGWLEENEFDNPIIKWDTKAWGEIPADFGRK